MNVADLTATLNLDDSKFKGQLASTVKKAQSQAKVKVAAEVDSKQADRGISRLTTSLKNLAKNRLKIGVDGSLADKALAKIKAGMSSVQSFGGKVGSAVGKVGDGVTKLGGGISKVFSNIGVPVLGAIGVAAAGVATGIAAISVKSLQLADNLDNAKISFTQFLGSGQKADAFLGDLRNLAAKTPFEFPELIESSKRLLAFGVRGKDVVGIMTTLGDAAALTGNSVDDLATIYGQMFAKGKVQNEELLQLTERGVPALQILADKLKISKSEVQDLASKGKLGADAIKALQEGIAEKFGGGMAKQAETLGGLISTLKDTLSGTLTDIGEGLLPIAKSIMPLFQKGAEGIGEKVKAMMPQIVDGVAAGVSKLLDLPGVILRGLASVSQGFANMVAGIQTSIADLVSGIATALAGIPGISDKDVAGLREASDHLRTSAENSKKIGAEGFNKLNAAAKQADKAVDPVKKKLEETRRIAQNGITLNMTLKGAEKAASDAKKKWQDAKSKLEKNPANPKLKANEADLKAKYNKSKAWLAQLNKYQAQPKLLAKDLASGKIKIVKGQIQSVKGKEVKVTAKADTSGVKRAKELIDAIHGKTVVVTTKHLSRKATAATGGFFDQGVIFRAGGGPVRGPGTATSDSINARLSDGEFVTNAAAVKKIGLDRMFYMNKYGELPTFKTGGQAAAVGRSLGASASPVRSSSNSSASSGTDRYALTITNWETGTGYMQKVAGDVVDTNEYFNASIDRMSLV